MDNTHGTTNCPFTAALAENAPQWAHENTSARAEAALNRNRSELTLAALCLCNPDDDVRHHTTCLTADLGQSTTAACDYRKIGLLLHRHARHMARQGLKMVGEVLHHGGER